jgi:hypothetical protein
LAFIFSRLLAASLFHLSFGRAFAEIESVIGIKIAPFDRYAIQDVLRGVGRAGEIALYRAMTYPYLIDDQFVQENLDRWLL